MQLIMRSKRHILLYLCLFSLLIIFFSCRENTRKTQHLTCQIVSISDNMPSHDSLFIKKYRKYPRTISLWGKIINETADTLFVPFKTPTENYFSSSFSITVDDQTDDIIGLVITKSRKHLINPEDTMVAKFTLYPRELIKRNMDKIKLEDIIQRIKVVYRLNDKDKAFSNKRMENLKIEWRDTLIVHRPQKGDTNSLCGPGVPLDCQEEYVSSGRGR